VLFVGIAHVLLYWSALG